MSSPGIATICGGNSFNVENSNRDMKQSTKKPSKFRRYFRPILSTLIVVCGSMAVGTTSGYPSMAIPNIRSNPKSPFQVSTEQQSWFASVKFLAGIPGAFISGLAMDRFGRKPVLLFGLLPMLIGWIFIMSAHDMNTMYVGRILTGFSASFIEPLIGVYISELSPPKIRGRLVSFHELFLNMGVLITYIVGTFLAWNWLALVCALFPFLSMVGLVFLPESPRWLMLKDRPELAIESLMWFKSTTKPDHVDKEFVEIKASVIDADKKSVPLLNYFKPPLLKIFITSLVVYSLQELCGISIIRFYAVDIFESAGTYLNSDLEAIVIGIAFVLSSMFGTSIVDRFERRNMLMACGLIMGTSLSAVGIFFSIQAVNPNLASKTLFWLPLLALITSTVGFTLGYGPLPNVVSSEMYSTAARARGTSISIAFMAVCGFLMSNNFMQLSNVMGKSGPFWICAGICILGTVFCYFMIPNTKGKTLEKIQKKLNKNPVFSNDNI